MSDGLTDLIYTWRWPSTPHLPASTSRVLGQDQRCASLYWCYVQWEYNLYLWAWEASTLPTEIHPSPHWQVLKIQFVYVSHSFFIAPLGFSPFFLLLKLGYFSHIICTDYGFPSLYSSLVFPTFPLIQFHSFYISLESKQASMGWQ